jgi:hypothetical protein
VNISEARYALMKDVPGLTFTPRVALPMATGVTGGSGFRSVPA